MKGDGGIKKGWCEMGVCEGVGGSLTVGQQILFGSLRHNLPPHNPARPPTAPSQSQLLSPRSLRCSRQLLPALCLAPATSTIDSFVCGA